MAIPEKAIDRLNNLPAQKRERKALYITICVLASCIITLMGLLSRSHANSERKDEEKTDIERRCSEQLLLMAQKYRSSDSAERAQERDRLIDGFNRQLDQSRKDQEIAQDRFDHYVRSVDSKASRIQEISRKQAREASKIKMP